MKPLLSRFRQVALVATLVLTGVAAPGGFLTHDTTVITVTDFTSAGRSLTAPTKEQPVYYMIIDYGKKPMDSTSEGSAEWSGEKLPSRAEALQWVVGALAEQNYLVATREHLPTLLLVFSWGMVSGGGDKSSMDSGYIQNPKRTTLGFLGGNKLDLMWEQERLGSMIDPRSLTRSFRNGIAQSVWELSAHSLFFGRVRAHTIESLNAPKKKLLWETRFACGADGTTLADSLPLMLKSSAPHFGRETVTPIETNATKVFGGKVSFGDLRIIEVVPDKKVPAKSKGKK